MSSSPEAIGKAVGTFVAGILILCGRAWLVAWCVSWFFPAFILAPWQWLVLVFTIRILICPSLHNDD